MWTNLGYWLPSFPLDEAETVAHRRQREYRVAASELARRVGAAAQLHRDDVVVDYACGFGDSLPLWVELFDAKRVVGVEPDPSVCELLESRIREWGLEGRVRVHNAPAELAPPRTVAPDVSAVVCVDAAYHFETRATWLQSVAESLPEGGRVAFSDLLWASSEPPGAISRAVARQLRIEPQNLVGEQALLAELRDCGLEPLASERCGNAVLDGFVRGAPRGSVAVTVTRAMLHWLRRSRRLDYTVTAAIQPIAPRSAIRG